MAKRPQLPSWDEIDKGPLPNRINPSVPTYEEVMFGRSVEQRASKRKSEETVRDWEVAIPKDVENAKDVENVGTEFTVAPTTNPKRPRALTIGYNVNRNTLIIIFRDNTWWQYNNVPSDIWVGLKNSPSTGKYLRESGLDQWSDMGPAEIESLSESVKAQLSSTAQSASDIQNSDTVLNKIIRGEASLRSFTAEEIFKDYL